MLTSFQMILLNSPSTTPSNLLYFNKYVCKSDII